MTQDAARRATMAGEPAEPSGTPGDDLIELLFFAYRDFVGDPDRILAQYGFGRAHHRVLHFVDRYPGLTIAELLDILRITKQSLNRVLKELVEKKYHRGEARAMPDRRQRLLFCMQHRRRAGGLDHAACGRAGANASHAALADLAAPENGLRPRNPPTPSLLAMIEPSGAGKRGVPPVGAYPKSALSADEPQNCRTGRVAG